jgi:hypothetical protein
MERTNLHLSEGYVIARGFLEKSSGESEGQIICGGIERPGRCFIGGGSVLAANSWGNWEEKV